jgi:hypothetical protein
LNIIEPNLTPSSLPIRGNVTPFYAASLGIAALAAAASAAGLAYPGVVYPSDEFRRAFVPSDAATLAVGLPILLGSMALARHGRLAGLLLWPGALLFMLYNYLIYFLCMPLNGVYFAFGTLVVGSGYAFGGLISVIDHQAVKDRLAGVVPGRLSGGVLAVLGGLFVLRAVGMLAGAAAAGTPPSAPELALDVSDIAVSPVWIIGGILLWRRKPSGYAAGLGLLFSLGMLFIGLMFVFILEPCLSATPFRGSDALVILAMSMIVFAPLALFVRGVMRGGKDG